MYEFGLEINYFLVTRELSAAESSVVIWVL